MANCKHLGKKVGKAECGCQGAFSVYDCKLLFTPAIPFPATPIYLHKLDGTTEKNPEILQCNQCANNTTGKQTHLPNSCT